MHPDTRGESDIPADDAQNQHYSSKLVIQSDFKDQGARPRAGDPYASPRISWGPNVSIGAEVQISAHVKNFGDPAGFVVVEFYRMRPVLGGTWKQERIGQSWPQKSVAQGPAEEFMCQEPWIPRAAHECLIAKILPGTSQGDAPSKTEFSPNNDPRVAQKNVAMIPGQPEPMSFTLGNPFSSEVPTVVFVRTRQIRGFDRHLAEQLGVTTSDLLTHAGDAGVYEALARRGVEVIDIQPGRGIRDVAVSDRPEPGEPSDERSQELLRQPQPNDDYRGSIVARTQLPPGSSREMAITFDEDAHSPDTVILHTLTQVSGGVVVGGYTIVMTPE